MTVDVISTALWTWWELWHRGERPLTFLRKEVTIAPLRIKRPPLALSGDHSDRAGRAWRNVRFSVEAKLLSHLRRTSGIRPSELCQPTLRRLAEFQERLRSGAW